MPVPGSNNVNSNNSNVNHKAKQGQGFDNDKRNCYEGCQSLTSSSSLSSPSPSPMLEKQETADESIGADNIDFPSNIIIENTSGRHGEEQRQRCWKMSCVGIGVLGLITLVLLLSLLSVSSDKRNESSTYSNVPNNKKNNNDTQSTSTSTRSPRAAPQNTLSDIFNSTNTKVPTGKRLFILLSFGIPRTHFSFGL